MVRSKLTDGSAGCGIWFCVCVFHRLAQLAPSVTTAVCAVVTPEYCVLLTDAKTRGLDTTHALLAATDHASVQAKPTPGSKAAAEDEHQPGTLQVNKPPALYTVAPRG